MDHKKYRYELIIEKYISKVKTILNYIILYVHISIRVESNKIEFSFYDFFCFTMIFQRFIQDKNKRKKWEITQRNQPGKLYVRVYGKY